ncbi:MAG: DMT family transporter [Pseudomonadota bacterium]
MHRSTANCLLLLAAAIWGMGFIAQSTAMDAIDPIIFTGVRFAVAALVLLPFAVWEHRSGSVRPEAEPPLGFAISVLIGAVLFGALASQQIGLVTTTVTNSGFLTGSYVIMVPILSALVLRVVPLGITWLGASFTLLGIALLTNASPTGVTAGDLWTLLCALFWAVHVLMVGVFAPKTGYPFRLAALQFAVCGVIGIGIGFVVETVSVETILAAWREILFTGIFSGGAAFTIQILAQRHTTPSQAAIFLSAEALFAALLGALLLGERLGTLGYVGCALMFAAMVLVELFGGRAPTTPKAGAHAK